MSPCQKKDLKLALTALERAMREYQPGDFERDDGAQSPIERDVAQIPYIEVMENFLFRLREALAGKPAPAAMERDGLAAAAAPHFAFRAPSPVAALRVTPSRPSFFSASVAEPRVTSDKPFVFGAKLDK